jgi:hypothetical protein
MPVKTKMIPADCVLLSTPPTNDQDFQKLARIPFCFAVSPTEHPRSIQRLRWDRCSAGRRMACLGSLDEIHKWANACRTSNKYRAVLLHLAGSGRGTSIDARSYDKDGFCRVVDQTTEFS